MSLISMFPSGDESGGVKTEPPENDVNFYDYDGTRLYSYTLAEAQALTELPPLPTQPGLICQEWNWDLADIKALGRKVDVGATYTTDDGKTRIYIKVEDDNITPRLECQLNGTLTIDWGDGTAHETITGKNISDTVYTSNHAYPKGEYIITITVDGEVVFFGKTSLSDASRILSLDSSSQMKHKYNSLITRVEIGENVSLKAQGFYRCVNLKNIVLSKNTVFLSSSSLFREMLSLEYLVVPKGMTKLSEYVFYYSTKLRSVSLPNTVTSIGTYTFNQCLVLIRQTLPQQISTLSQTLFHSCSNLSFIEIPNVTNIGTNCFRDVRSLQYIDLTCCTNVPTLTNVEAFANIPTACEIRVPAALYDEWIAATNWSTYASQIVAV